MQARTCILPVLVLSLSGGFACRDHLTGPEAVRLIDEVETSFATDGRLLRFDQLLFQMGWQVGQVELSEFSFSKAVVSRDGQRRTYSAFVIERVMIPSMALGPVEMCVRAGLLRRAASFWREGSADEIELQGSDFNRPLALKDTWSCPYDPLRVLEPGPTMFYSATPADAKYGWWEAREGRADISPGIVIGPCPFLRPTHAQYLREQRGVSCELTRHQVSFEATARQWDASIGHTRTPRSRVELRPTEIAGIHYTIHCDGAGDLAGKCPSRVDTH